MKFGRENADGRYERGPFRRVFAGFALGSLALACSTHAERSGLKSERLIDGDLAPAESGTVWLTHPGQAFLCSGAIVHPRLVVTTKHCVFASRTEGDEPLSASGFRVGFGPDQESQEFGSVTASDWVGAPLVTSIASAVAAGQDVAVLELSTPVPAGTHVHSIAWNFTPLAQQQFLMVGFGLSSLTLGTVGARRSATGTITGFSPQTGIVQLAGKSACFGDSGGPILFGTNQEWVGTISQIGGSSADQFCDIGLTFGATLLNPEVRALLQRALAQVGSGAGGAPAIGEGGKGGEAGAGGTSPLNVNQGGTPAGGAPGMPLDPSTGARAPVHVGTLAPLPAASGGSQGTAEASGGASGAASGVNGGGPQLVAKGGCSLGGGGGMGGGLGVLLSLGLGFRARLTRQRRARC
ncbi:MAG: trypsin-like serine protease [Polyangiaceae bacterium]|nr:trypsin-like serine protease [Polyangiaceae bacterium]